MSKKILSFLMASIIIFSSSTTTLAAETEALHLKITFKDGIVVEQTM